MRTAVIRITLVDMEYDTAIGVVDPLFINLNELKDQDNEQDENYIINIYERGLIKRQSVTISLDMAAQLLHKKPNELLVAAKREAILNVNNIIKLGTAQ